ncbi:MAG: redoxin domain-containing protein [Bacteroidales bacterium]|nr:redoxin domain-containing protein [Bacteroidales bacterium]
MKIFKIVIWLTLSVYQLANSQTLIKCERSEYKSQRIVFYSVSDYITQKIDTVADLSTDNNGTFYFEYSTTKFKQLFVDLGIYKASMYVDPNIREYRINLPEKKDKTEADLLNIYFQPTEIRIEINNTDKNEINALINSFDLIFTDFTAKKFDSIYQFPQKKIEERFQTKIHSYYGNERSDFFNDYIDYSVYSLMLIGKNRDYKTITSRYFNNKPILWDNQPYMILFNLMYNDFFQTYSNTKDGSDLLSVITYSRSPKKLIENILMNVSISDSTFAELAAIKGIHDALIHPIKENDKVFPKPQLNIILDSIANFSNVPMHRKMAKNIQLKFRSNKSKIGEEIPDFKVMNRDGDFVYISENKGKPIYLMFLRTDIVECMEDLDRLSMFYDKHKDDIEIVSIVTDNTPNQFFKLSKFKYQWSIYYLSENTEIANYFNLITWPQYHLIDQDFKLIVSPAKSLKDNFEMEFFKYLDSKR